jgi:hypothetical protein
VTRLWRLVELTDDRDGRDRVAAFIEDELPAGSRQVSRPV